MGVTASNLVTGNIGVKED